MNPEKAILRDLLVGRSTADSLAGRVGLHPAAAETILRRMEREGKVETRPLKHLTIFQLTTETILELRAP